MDPFDELERHYPEIISRMPERFNSHEFILQLAYEYQRLYIKALAMYAEAEGWPFMIVHGRLAKGLIKYPDLVKDIGDEPSRDIFGHSSSAALWRKLK
ncbi:MAG: hypothetical protein AB1435_16270 [Chloroflexota bacterium]